MREEKKNGEAGGGEFPRPRHMRIKKKEYFVRWQRSITDETSAGPRPVPTQSAVSSPLASDPNRLDRPGFYPPTPPRALSLLLFQARAGAPFSTILASRGGPRRSAHQRRRSLFFFFFSSRSAAASRDGGCSAREDAPELLQLVTKLRCACPVVDDHETANCGSDMDPPPKLKLPPT